jgi:hypothetical protein
MFIRDSFKPTPSRFAFEPESFTEITTAPKRIERELRGYWWEGSPKRRTLHHGTFHFTWESLDERLAPYQYMDYRKLLRIAAHAASWRNNLRVWDYSITKTAGATYTPGFLNILRPGWDASALREFLDSHTSMMLKPNTKPLDHPRGTDGWYSNAHHGVVDGEHEQDIRRLFHYEQYKAELDGIETGFLTVQP